MALSEADGINCIINLSSLYSAIPLSKKYLIRFLKETVVSNISVHSYRNEPYAFALMRPYLLKNGHYIDSDGTQHITCCIEHWGRNPVFTDKELIAFLTRSIYEWVSNIGKQIIDGYLVHSPRGFIQRYNPLPPESAVFQFHFKIKFDPEDYELMTVLHSSKSLIVKRSQKINENCLIFYGSVNANHDIIQEIFNES